MIIIAIPTQCWHLYARVDDDLRVHPSLGTVSILGQIICPVYMDGRQQNSFTGVSVAMAALLGFSTKVPVCASRESLLQSAACYM